MRPEEAHALERFRRTTTLLVISLCAVFVGVSAFQVIHTASDPDSRQHFLGQSRQMTAEVVAEDRAGSCRLSSRYAYTLQWTEDGEQRSESINRCDDRYDVGDTIDIWATDGMPYTESAAMWRWLIAGLLVVFAAFALLLGRVLRRVRRAVAAGLGGEPPAGTFPTTGNPLTGKLEVLLHRADGSPLIHRIPRGRVIHRTISAQPPAEAGPIRGRITVSDLRRGKPRGLALYEGDNGTRLWRFLG